MRAILRTLVGAVARLVHWAVPELFPERQLLDERDWKIVALEKELAASREGALVLAREVRSQYRSLCERIEFRYATRLAERDRQIESLTQVADHDPLTGLYNRHGAKQELDRVLAHFERQDHETPHLHELSILMMDLNNFKAVNDQFGHAAGDQVLVVVSEHLKKAFRTEDIILRKGGDEFVAYLINATKTGAIKRAEELAALMQTDGRLRFGETQVSISIGISHGSFSTKRGGFQILNEVERLADAAMYGAKEQQRGSSGIMVADDAVFSDTILGGL